MFNTSIKTNSNEYILDDELNKLLEDLKIDYTAFYRGIVIDNLDPEYKGRIKVRVPQIYGVNPSTQYFVPTEMIPWAICAIAPASNDSGTFLPPNIGDTVFITFENGEPDTPMYFGGLYTTRKEDTSKKGVGSSKLYNNSTLNVGVDDLPGEVINGTERIIYKSLKGAVIMIDDKDGSESIKITDQSGQSIIMENTSEKTLKRRGTELGVNSKSQIVLTNSCGDSITLSQGKIHLKSSNIIFETDNFEQIGLSEYDDEINLADIILGNEKALINFRVIDVRTGQELSEAVTEVNKLENGNVTHVATYTSPQFTLELSAGSYMVKSTSTGYYEANQTLEVVEGVSQEYNILMSKETSSEVNDVQIVVTWNGAISDIDSHTKIYDNDMNEISHVNYSNTQFVVDGTSVINLDVDDTDYYGPETTTINTSYPYRYLFYVHRFSDGIISSSYCRVQVINKGVVVASMNIPIPENVDESYAFWKVFEYVPSTGEMNIINELTSSEPSLRSGE